MFMCCIIQWVRSISHRFTQMNRTHKGAQRHQVNRFHRTLQPTEASPPAPLRMERGVNTEIPLYVLRMIRMYSPPVSKPVGVTSHTTPLSIRRGAGGEAALYSTQAPYPIRLRNLLNRHKVISLTSHKDGP